MTAPSASTTSTVPAGFSGAPGTDDFPVRLGSPESFAAVRRLFEAADFHETSVARRLGGTQLFGFPRLCDGRKQLAGPPSDANAVLIRLLLDGEPLPAATARALCGDAGIDALCALGVLVPQPSEPEALRATLMLAPVRGLWLASDASRARTRRPDPALERRDFVFPPLSELTREFLDVLPVRPGARALELCAGSGVAAHLLARGGVAEAWATDITARSVHYTRFNAALNELPRDRRGRERRLAGARRRDVRPGRRAPALRARTGARVRLPRRRRRRRADRPRHRAGAPRAPAPRGVCAITCAFGESRAEPAEARVRAWLGDAASEFDLVVLQRRDWDGLRMYRSVVPQEAARDYQDAERWLRHFAALGVEGFAHVSFELRRTAAGRAPITERRMAGPVTSAAAFDWQSRGPSIVRPRTRATRRRAWPGTGRAWRPAPRCTSHSWPTPTAAGARRVGGPRWSGRRRRRCECRRSRPPCSSCATARATPAPSTPRSMRRGCSTRT
jgi:hypothetical protein